MPVLGAATLELNADSAKLEQDLGRAVAMASAWGTTIGTVIGQAVSGAVNHVVNLTKSAIDAADAADKISQKFGVSTQDFAIYSAAARLADVSTSSLTMAMRNLANASNREGQAGKAFEAMGIDVKEFGGDTKKVFDAVMQKLGQYEDSLNKSALANAVLGRSGSELIPLANEMEKNTRLARELGVTLDKETAAAAAQFKDNLTASRIASEQMGVRIAAVLLPSMEKLSEFLVGNAKNTEKLDTVTRAADTGLKLLATGFTVVSSIVQMTGERIGGFAAVVGRVLHGDFSGALRIAKETVSDQFRGIGETANTIGKIWDDAAGKVVAKAEDNGGKLAAPAIEATKKVRKNNDELREEIFRAQKILELEDLATTDRVEASQAQANIDRKNGEERERQAEAATRSWVESAELQVRAAEEIIYTWNEAGDRVEMTREQFELLNKETKDGDDIGRRLGLTFTSAFEDAVVGGKKLSDVIKGLGMDIARLITRMMITEPFANAVKDQMSGFKLGNIDWKGMFNFGGDGSAAGLTGGTFADGGRPPMGRVSLVGERGPELFVPDTAGTIIPSGQFGGGVTIHNSIVVQGDGVTMPDVHKAMAAWSRQTVAAVEERRKR